MPKYLFAQNVTAEELNDIGSLKKLGYRQFQRGRIIELSALGWRCPQISQATGLSVERVRQWIHRFNQYRTAGLIAKKSTGRPRKFPQQIRDRLRALIGDCPMDYGTAKTRWTLTDVCQVAVAQNLVQSVSTEQVRQLFVEVNWTYTRAKKWQLSPDAAYRRRRNRQRSLERWAMSDDQIDLIYCDQFWRNLLYLPMAGSYSPKGESQRVAPNGRVSLSTYLALDQKTRYVHHWYGSRCCTDQTIAWLKPMIRRYQASKALIVAWDKAPWHTSKKMRRFVRRWNHYAKRTSKVRIILHYFPTQAPWLNPSEAVIGMIVRYGLQNQTHITPDDLRHSIDGYLHWRNNRSQNLVV
jgi:transposase